MDLNLNKKTALITGAGRGVGKTTALALAQEGITVCLISRTESELIEVCDEIKDKGGRAYYYVFDLSSSSDYQELKNKIISDVGSIDILINNAAHVSTPKKVSYLDEKEWNQIIDIDLNAVFRLSKLFIDDMKNKKWGRVINIGSLSASVGVSSYPAYCAAKAGLEGLTKNMAVDYSKFGITINMISPGFIETERFKKAAPQELIEKYIGATSVKRLGKAEDISDSILFLASERASYITGINLLVCGGLNLGNLW
jgi:NAD(P)-dependent dehydrogenase (short-subunit alcohol dehydrogenase family)